MSSIKSKDKSSTGQKFWHLKKLALGNKSNTNDQAQQRPPSPAGIIYIYIPTQTILIFFVYMMYINYILYFS